MKEKEELLRQQQVSTLDRSSDEEETLTKMRLMSLGGIRNGGGEVSYKEICDKLKIDSKECEEWVVRGISSGLVDAKLESLEVSTMGLILASCHFKAVLSYFKDPQVW